jgi:cysteine desulfurase
MAVAFELAVAERDATVRRVRKLRDRLRGAILAEDGVELTGHPRDRLPNLLSVVVGAADGASIVVKLDLQGIAASVGSACTTGSTDPSHVLTAMGYPDEEARGSLRISLGRTTTDEEIDRSVEIIPRVLADSRAAAAVLAADPLGQGVGVA